MGTTKAKCSCGLMPKLATCAPKRPAEKKPMLQNAWERFMIRRPTINSVRSASAFSMISTQPITTPTGSSIKNKIKGEGACTAKA